jgi:hypothetical protein
MMRLDQTREHAANFIVAVRKQQNGAQTTMSLDECKRSFQEHFSKHDVHISFAQVQAYAAEWNKRNIALSQLLALVESVSRENPAEIEAFLRKREFCEQTCTDLSAELEGEFYTEDRFMELLSSTAASVNGFMFVVDK